MLIVTCHRIVNNPKWPTSARGLLDFVGPMFAADPQPGPSCWLVLASILYLYPLLPGV